MGNKKLRYSNHVCNYVYFKIQIESLGVGCGYSGFYFLIGIMNILINEDKKVKSFSREIYPSIASEFNVNEGSIERDIRHMIKKCWNYELMEKLGVYYPENKKPTCQKFIYLIKDYICNSLK